jgi:Mn2+/Fe2+ NRAMP family transporter
LWAILLANLFKYPFFEFGSRYANATDESIIDGYLRIGKWFLWIYLLITLGSMFFVMAAVGVVTAGFLDNLFGVSNLKLVTGLLFVSCVAILIAGKYKLLDSLIKVIGSVLLVSTIAAFVLTLFSGPQIQSGSLLPQVEWNSTTFAFLIALMGWMPTAVDMSTWNSLWTIERIRSTGYKPTLKETLLDFNLGYIISAVLSICFVTLGAYIVFGTGLSMPESSAGFANRVVSLYTETMGSWSYPIIATAAFSIMLGTCIAVFDGYSRAVERSAELLFLPREKAKEALNNRSFYIGALVILAIGGFLVIYYMLFVKEDSSGFKQLIDLATTISFIIAPIIAIVNLRLVSSKFIPKESVPPLWLKSLAWCGIVFLGGFTLFYLWLTLFSS